MVTVKILVQISHCQIHTKQRKMPVLSNGVNEESAKQSIYLESRKIIHKECRGLHSAGSMCNTRFKNEGKIYYASSRALGKAFEDGRCGKTGARKIYQKKNDL